MNFSQGLLWRIKARSFGNLGISISASASASTLQKIYFCLTIIFVCVKTRIFMSGKHQYSFLFLEISADLLFLSQECHFFCHLFFFNL